MNRKLTDDLLSKIKSVISYDPVSGLLFKLNGDEVKTSIVRSKNVEYLTFFFKSSSLRVHRVAYALHTGIIPIVIDHIDGNGINNKWSNIRNVTNHENLKNQRMRKNNKSGVTGVQITRSGKWEARIQVDGEKIWLGIYEDIKDAALARKKAEKKFGFHPNHGSIR